MRKVFVCICLLQLIMVGTAAAQANRATITGTVTDPSGGTIQGVEVTAVNHDTNVPTSSVTNETGIYSILNLPPGSYSLQFRSAGFKPVDFPNITLIEAQVAQVNATLHVGAVTETVEVRDEAPLLDRETADIGTNLKGTVVGDLPMNVYGGRAIESFVYAITPGAQGDPYTAVINGNQVFTKDFTVDGTSGTAQIQGDSMEVGPSMEGVEEVQAVTSGMSSQSASTNGGVIMFNLKSGTNQFHGSASLFGHNELLDANTWDNNRLGLAKPKARFWDYAGNLGGPIWRNKAFFSVTFERFTQQDFTPGGFSATVPTANFLQGDFSALLDTSTVLGTDAHGNPIYSGAIFNPSDPGAVFLNNKVPTTMFSNVAQKIVQIYKNSYVPEQPGLFNNNRLPASNSPAQTPNEFSAKLDYNINTSNHLSGSWIYNHRPRTLVDSGGVWSSGSTDGGPLADSRYQMVKGSEWRVSDSHTLRPNLLNVFNVTYNWYWNGSLPTNSASWPGQIGLGNGYAANFPSISFGNNVNGYGMTAIGNTWQGFYVSSTMITGDQVSWVHGRHTVSFGGDFRAMEINSHAGSGALSFSFSNQQTGDPIGSYAGKVGFGFASFLLGLVDSASSSTPFDLYGRRKATSFFVTDSYKTTPRLTLTLGLRWEGTFPLHEKYGHWANFDLNAVDPATGTKGAIAYAKGGGDSFEKYENWKNFAPQVGAAYSLTNRVVLRGAYGITYAPLGIQFWQGVPYGFAPGYRGTNEVKPVGGSAEAFNWDSGYPGVFTPGTKDPSNIPWGPVSIDPHTLDLGYTHNFNAGVQYQLTKNILVSASYVGNRGRRLHDPSLAFNESDHKTFLNLVNSGHFWDWVQDSTTAAKAGVPFPYAGFQGYAFQAIVPYPQVATLYSPIYYVGTPKGQSTYDSMVIEVVKRGGRGLTMDLSYTLSRSLGDVYTNFTENWWSGYYQDFTNLSVDENTLTGYDQKHVVKGFVTYDLPFGRGHWLLHDQGRFVNALVHGWTVSGIVRYASGTPLTINSAANANYYAPWGYAWANIYPNYNLAGYNGSQFNKSAFTPWNGAGNPPAGNLYFPKTVASDPPFGAFGTGPVRVSQLRGFGEAYENASLQKAFAFGTEDRFRLLFRVEFYNLFNRHYFANPDSNIGDAGFGYVSNVTGSPRNGQFAIRFLF
jgi:hypothetical protein